METKMEEMDDWNDDTLLPVVSKGRLSSWDDEDVENNKVKESWEDEDGSTLVPLELPPLNNSTRKVVSKPSERKGKIAAGGRKDKRNAMEEKFCQLRLDGGAYSGSNGDQSVKKSIDDFVPITKMDFLEYAKLISEKLRVYERSYYYLGLLKDVMRFSMEALGGADAKEIASCVAAISNERLKAEREAAGRKWKTGASKKKKIYVEKEVSATVVAYAALDAHAELDFDE